MEIKIEQSTLLRALELITRISTKHVTLPVLQCVFIEAIDDRVVLRATNLEIGMEVTLATEVAEPGVIAVPSQTLLQTTQLLPPKPVTLKVEEGTLVIEGPHSETHIKSIPHDEFPTIPKLDGVGQPINRAAFALGIKTVAFAASQSSIKPELGSVNVYQRKEHSLTFVATDSFRLMEKTVAQKGVVLDEAVLIPQRNAIELARVCDLLTGEPTLHLSENQCALTFPEDGVYITSRLVAGSFPDYEQIIPKEFSTHTTVLKNELLAAFRKTNVFLNKFFQVTATVTKDSITISANNGEVGTTTDSVTAQTEGEELTLSFNQQYLMEPLQHLPEESVVLHFAGIGRPLVIEGKTDRSLRYLVMPMNK